MRDPATFTAALPAAEFKDGAFVIPATAIVESLESLKKLGSFMLFDICCEDRPEAFELSYRLLDMLAESGTVLSIRVVLDRADPSAPTAMGVWKGADVLEREVWDLMGIRFTGRPALERILNREDFEGHPLRKDFQMPKRDRFPAQTWDKKAAEGGL